MVLSAALGLPPAAADCRSMPRMPGSARVGRVASAPSAASAGMLRRRLAEGGLMSGLRGYGRGHAVAAKAAGHSAPAGHGQDLQWEHVAKDLKEKLARVYGGKDSKLEQLQSWLGEAKLTHTGETDMEESQTEICAEEEADHMGLGQMKVDAKSWLANPTPSEEDTDSKMAGVFVVRLLQAYHEKTGEAFDDESEDCYWRLQGLIPGGLVDALDHDLLKRMMQSYVSMPFSNV